VSELLAILVRACLSVLTKGRLPWAAWRAGPKAGCLLVCSDRRAGCARRDGFGACNTAVGEKSFVFL
tara:strand:+ start:448 stop:648 length:201 start_codon:yes stop_codon:yes gene_type:complete